MPHHQQPVAILMVGMEGSGKTELGKAICARLQPCRLFCDFLRERYASLAGAIEYASLKAAIAEGSNVVLNDVSWIEPQKLERAATEMREIAPNYEQFIIYFENDPVRCAANAEERNVRVAGDLDYIRSRTNNYIVPDPPPANSVVVPVWSPEVGDRSLQRVLAALQPIEHPSPDRSDLPS